MGNVIATVALEGAEMATVDQQTDSLLYGPTVAQEFNLDEDDQQFLQSIQPIGN